MKRVISLFIITITLLPGLIFGPIDSDYVTTSNLHLREGPGTSYQSMMVLPENTIVKFESVSAADSLWFRVNHDGEVGYSFSKYLSPNEGQGAIISRLIYLYIFFPFTAFITSIFWKFKTIAAILALFYGLLGLHWLYLGDRVRYSIQMVSYLTFDFTALFVFIYDFFYILGIHSSEFQRSFNTSAKDKINAMKTGKGRCRNSQL